MSNTPTRSRDPQRNRLAASVMTILAVAAPSAHALATWQVNSCAEGVSGDTNTRKGTLRFALANAASDDTIVFALPVTCHSTISLTTGALDVAQTSLYVSGPADRVTITAQGSSVKDRIVKHTATGTLTLRNLNIEYGAATTEATELGGCIYSKGSVTLDHSGVYGCQAKSSTISGTAYGGGIFTAKDLHLLYSTVAGNLTSAAVSTSNGGGAYVDGYLTSRYSTITGNKANGNYGRGGGVIVSGHGANITSTTISGNTARRDFGGVLLRGAAVTITNSTISGNNALQGFGGGIYATAPLTLHNNTIAFNSAALGTHNSHDVAPGLTVVGQSGTLAVDLQSTLISNNTYTSSGNIVDNDFTAVGLVDLSGSANNLIYAAHGLTLGSAALVGACPLLGPLRDNGGLAWTHQLLSHSPAIDAGNDTTTVALQWDQRGAPFKRQSGLSPDIGAYEVQQDDVVFNGAFDGCPPG